MINPTTKQLYEKMLKQKEEETATVRIKDQDRSFVVPSSVFPPEIRGLSISSSSVFNRLSELVGQEVLDLGTGCGVLAIAAALAGAERVVATDINPNAIRATQQNAIEHGVANKIEAIECNLFGRVYEKFDLIIANLPIVDALVGWGYLSLALYDPDYRLRARFLREAKQYLKPGGRISFTHANLQSAMTNDPFADFRRLEQLIDFYGYRIDTRNPIDAYDTIWIHYEIVPTTDLPQNVRNRLSWRFRQVETLKDKRLYLLEKLDERRTMRPYCISCAYPEWDEIQEKLTRLISDTTRLINRLGG